MKSTKKRANSKKPVSRRSLRVFTPGPVSVSPDVGLDVLPAGVDSSTPVLQGSTTHFKVYSAAELGDIGVNLAQAALAVCETDYATLQGLFNVQKPGGLPFKIYVEPGRGGAYHSDCSSTQIHCFAEPSVDPEYLPLLVVAEMDEVFMANQKAGWNCGASNGEALSRVVATDAHPTQKLPVGACWLNTLRPDFISNTDPTDANMVSVGCGTLFLNYLRNQCFFTLGQIVAAGGSTLQKTFATLTGSTEALGTFTWLLQKQFPIGTSVQVDDDNQFPIYDPMAPLGMELAVTLQNGGSGSASGLTFVGTRGMNLRLETFAISFQPGLPNLTVVYMAHVQGIGDTANPNDPTTWTTEGNVVGITGSRLEGFAILLMGPDAPLYTVSYMAHLQGKGDTDWVKDGAFCGTRGQSRRVEGMSVKVVPRVLDLTVHLNGLGDRTVNADEFAGTRGQNRRLEQFEISLDPPNPNLGLVYMANVHGVGDTANFNDQTTWATEGTRIGLQGKQVQGFAIALTGPDAPYYDVSYMAHVHNVGDSQWFWNGDFCGTRQNRQVEGMRIRVTRAMKRE